MEANEILKTYQRYLQTINDATNCDLFNNYKKMKDFMQTNCTDNELWFNLKRHSIGRNIKEIEKRGFKIRDVCTSGWNASITKESYRLLRKIKEHENDGDMSTYTINFRKFVELADKQNPYLELYLWYCFDKIDNKLLKVTMNEVVKAAANAIIQENGVEEDANHNTSTEIETTPPHNDK